MSTPVVGLAPYLPPHRPRADAVWWHVEGHIADDGQLEVHAPKTNDHPPSDLWALTGLCAPCSLPRAFVQTVCGADAPRVKVIAHLGRWTRSRLFREVHAFARAQPRGRRHPKRHPHETLRSLDRRALARFHAAIPLLQNVPVAPWHAERTPHAFEVDPYALREREGKQGSTRRDSSWAVVAKGIGLTPPHFADCNAAAFDATGPRHALCGLLASAAWVARGCPAPPADAEAWIPVARS